MGFNLLEMVKDQAGDVLVSNASKLLGESADNTSSAVNAIFPSILGSVIKMGSDDKGASGLMDMMKGMDMGFMDDLGGALSGGDATNNLMSAGSGMLSTLMGGGMSSVVDKVAGLSNMGTGSVAKLMKMAAPMLMGTLGKYVMKNGLDAAGLGKLLGSQKSIVGKLLPSGFSDLLGLGSILGAVSGAGKAVAGAAGDVVKGAADVTGDVARGAADAGKAVVGAAGDAGKAVVGAAGDAGKAVVGAAGDVAEAGVNTGKSLLKWLIPVLLVLAVLSFFGIKTCSPIDNATSAVKDTTKDVATATVDATKKGVEMAGDAVAATGDAVVGLGKGVLDLVSDAAMATLDGVNWITGGVGEQVYNWIKSGAEGAQNFNFKNLNFATGSAEISAEGMEEIAQLATILKEVKDLRVEIDGHTDNTGDAAANKSLSQQRADAVKMALAKNGVAANRIDAVGYGAEKPVASNDTEEGRAANRRTSVILKK